MRGTTMFEVKNISRLAVAFSMAVLLTACATYYKVKDPATGETYYTDKVKRESGGAAMFKDARTNAEVTIQNSEIMEITKDEYKGALMVPAPTPMKSPAPEAAPAPAPEEPAK
jgi:hypothetical protein